MRESQDRIRSFLNESNLIRMEAWNENWQTWETKDLYGAYQTLSRENPGQYPNISHFEQFEHAIALRSGEQREKFLRQLQHDYSVSIKRSVEQGMEIVCKYLESD